MAKRKSQKAVDGTGNGLKHVSLSNGAENFRNDPNESAFAGLHQKIEAQLQKSPKEKRPLKPPLPKSTKASAKNREPKDLSPASQAPVQGKKRDRHGHVLDRSTKNPPQRMQSGGNSDGVAEKGILETEIMLLGGTAEDLALLDGAESESEMEGDNNFTSQLKRSRKGDGLEKGIQNILAEIALSQNKNGPAEDSSNGSEAEETHENPIPDSQGIQPLAGPQLNSNAASKTSRLPKSDLRCESRPDWYNATYLVTSGSKQPKYTLSNLSLEQVQRHARLLLDKENEIYRKTQQHSSSQGFYNTVIASGTLSDKISALTLAVQESPLHNVKALETLIGLAKKRSRAQAVDVLRALKDLFGQGSLLPSDRRLYPFASQPGLIAGFTNTKTWSQGDELPDIVKESQLAAWCFEDWLKEQYFEVLKTLEVWCNDEIEFSKSRAVNYVFELLKEKPEQESNLLRLLINKLGDPVKKIASQTSYLLMQLLAAHPAMKETVISAIEADFLFRPGQSMHGKYYAIVTLNQTALSTQEEGIAIKLLHIYFSLFGPLLKPNETDQAAETGGTASTSRAERRNKRSKSRDAEVGQNKEVELREKFIAAILTGVNRAYPYSDSDGRNLSAHLETLFKVTHSSNFNTSVQAMMLIQQMSSSHQASSDRFYRTLYESLLDARLATSSKQQLYLNLLHKALKADLNLKRVKAFVKRMLQILSLHEPPFVCAAFFLLKDLESTFPSLSGLIDQPEEHENEEEFFRDVEDEESASADELVKKATVIDSSQATIYHGRKRDPEHSHADNSCAWELLPFLAHFHPSVSVSAENLLRHAKMPGKPDLDLHTLIHFLDRFVYRNPKQAASNLRGSSIMQPMGSNDTRGVLISNSITSQVMPVNTDNFRMKKDDQIAAEDVFFHKYFNSLGKESSVAKGKNNKTKGNEGSIGEEDEDAVWTAMMNSAPDLEGANDSDEDLAMSDLESDFEDGLEEMSEDEMDDAGEVDKEEIPSFGSSEDEMVDVSDGVSPEEKTVARNSDLVSRARNADAREKRKKMKALPTFASASDYAEMLEDDEDEDLGL